MLECSPGVRASELQALFEEDASDLLLNVFDTLHVRQLLRVCAPSCRRVREYVARWYPWRATALSWCGINSQIIAEQYVAAAQRLPSARRTGKQNRGGLLPDEALKMLHAVFESHAALSAASPAASATSRFGAAVAGFAAAIAAESNIAWFKPGGSLSMAGTEA